MNHQANALIWGTMDGLCERNRQSMILLGYVACGVFRQMLGMCATWHIYWLCHKLGIKGIEGIPLE